MTRYIELTNIDALQQEIQSDITNLQFDRFAVRFIIVDTQIQYRELLDALNEFNLCKIDLAHEFFQLKNGKDLLPSCDEVAQLINQKDSSYIKSFSEYARFFCKKELHALFNSITGIENNRSNAKRRIYIPIVSLGSFQDYWATFFRRSECKPPWYLTRPSSELHQIRVCFWQPSQPLTLAEDETSQITITQNVYEWMKILYTSKACRVLCTSKPLCSNSQHLKNEVLYRFCMADNIKELLEKFWNIVIPYEYINEEKAYWEKLLTHRDLIHKANDDFFDFVPRFLNHHGSLDAPQIIKIWGNVDDFAKWLMRIYAIQSPSISADYLSCVLKNYSFDRLSRSLLSPIYEYIFTLMEDRTVDLEFYLLCRQSYIKYFDLRSLSNSEASLQRSFTAFAQRQEEDAIKCIVGDFQFEGCFILDYVKRVGELPVEKKKDLLSRIPRLKCYQTDYVFESSQSIPPKWLLYYLQEYKDCKISNSLSSTLVDIICSADCNRNADSFFAWYSSIKPSSSIVRKYPLATKIWVDGLGIDWLPYVEQMLKKSYPKVHYIFDFACCKLPSSTEYNQFDFDKIPDLDNFFHDGHFRYPNSLMAEFKVVDIIIEKLVDRIPDFGELLVVSDHGATALSRLAAPTRWSTNTSHEGRYTDQGTITQPCDDFICYEGKCIALRHSSLGNKPSRIVHGGCCPEEVLTPIIRLSYQLLDKTSRECYLISAKNQRLSSINPRAIFLFSSIPKNPQLWINSESIDLICNKENPMEWSIEKSKIPTGTHELTLTFNDNILTINITHESGFLEEELF